MRSVLPLAFLLAACGGPDISQSRLPACGSTPAPSLFEHALCLCGDYLDVGLARIGPGADPASIAVNGKSASVSETIVQGDFLAYGGLSATADMHVKGDLASAADVQWVGALDVDGDVSVGGDFTGVGDLDVEGSMAVGGEHFTIGLENVGGKSSYAAPAGPPCSCDASTFLDVAAMVELARTDNDNQARGVDDARIFTIGDASLQLETGRYYFSDVTAIGRAHLTIAGVVSIYLDGDLATVGDGRIELMPGSSLDLYVAGSVASVGKIDLGDKSNPSSFRLYIGGDRSVEVGVGLTEIAGSIYAPRATIVWVGDTQIDGAVFADTLGGVGLLDVRYTRPVAVEVEPGECPPPQQPSGGNGDPGKGQPEI